MSVIKDLISAIRCRNAVVALDAPAPEELTVMEELAEDIESLGQHHQMFSWSEASGLTELGLAESGLTMLPIQLPPGNVASAMAGPVANILDHIKNEAMDEPTDKVVYVLCDAHVHINGGHNQSGAIRRLKELALLLKRTSTSVVLIGENLTLDPSLDGLVPKFNVKLPDADALKATADGALLDLTDSSFPPKIENDEISRLVDGLVNAGLGLTCQEFADAIRLAALKGNGLNFDATAVVLDRKLEKLRRLGADFAPAPDVSVGGLDLLMTWVQTRRKLLAPEAKANGVPFPKGILLVGVPGTGKSLVAKSIGSKWGLPVMSLDVGSLYGGIVGQTESNIRKLLETADACAPCILLIDEIEKALAGATGHNGDSGTSKRLFGTLLSWMNDHQSSVFVVATANDISALPPELKRKGRFDEIFSVGLPTSKERRSIVEAHLDRHDIALTAEAVEDLVVSTAGFTGAEIGAAVQAAKVESYCGDDDNMIGLLTCCIAGIEPQFKNTDGYGTGDINARPASSSELKTKKTAVTIQ